MTIRGLAFPFGTSFSSLPAASTDDDVIADNIRRILLTRRGSRVMRPSTGSNVIDFVFENIGPVLRARIDDEVRRALSEGEPRAQVLEVRVFEQETFATGRQVEVIVDITYRVLAEVRRTAVSIPRVV